MGLGHAVWNVLHTVPPLLLVAQVKNVSGRLLVGLRWWNEVSESGGSDWKFESLSEGQRAVNKHDARVFWLVLYITPPLWVLLGLVAVLKLNVDYLLLVIIAVLLSTANLVGYLKCSKAAQAQLKGVTSGLVTAGIKVRPRRERVCRAGRVGVVGKGEVMWTRAGRGPGKGRRPGFGEAGGQARPAKETGGSRRDAGQG